MTLSSAHDCDDVGVDSGRAVRGILTIMLIMLDWKERGNIQNSARAQARMPRQFAGGARARGLMPRSWAHSHCRWTAAQRGIIICAHKWFLEEVMLGLA